MFLAHPAGFEPTAPRLGGECSIQLSYGCIHVLTLVRACELLALRRRSLYPAELRVLMPSAAESAPGKKGGLSLLSSTWPDIHNRQPIIEESREKVNPLVSHHTRCHPASGLLSRPAKCPCSAPRGSPVHPQAQIWSCPRHPKARCAKPYCRSSPPPGHSFPLR